MRAGIGLNANIATGPRCFVVGFLVACFLLLGSFAASGKLLARLSDDPPTQPTDAPAEPPAEPPADPPVDPPVDPPAGDNENPESHSITALQRSLNEYDAASSHLPRIHGKDESLEFYVQIYPDAWQAELLRRLRLGIARDKSLADITADIASISKKSRKALEDKAMFRLQLLHPTLGDDLKPGESQPVHFFAAPGDRSLKLGLGGRHLQWAFVAQRGLDTLKTLRIGNHQTIRRGQRVPYISPVKPRYTRWVFWGKSAEWTGVFSKKTLEKLDKMEVTLSFESFLGAYDDRHLIDLNEPNHVWNQDQTIHASGSLPDRFPELPEPLRRFLHSFDQ